MATNWNSHLAVLQEGILQAMDSFQDFHHAVMLVKSDLLSDLPNVSTMGGWESIRQIIVSLPSGRYHLHFFGNEYYYGSDPKSFEFLWNRLQQIHTILAKIPVRILPKVAVPPMENRLDENLVRWMYCLHWLASVPENHAFHAEQEFLLSKDDLAKKKQFKPWAECPTVPDFDPTPYLTLSNSATEPLEKWIRRCESDGRQFPEVIASSLTKPVLYASANAIDLLRKSDVGFEQKRRVKREKLFTSGGKRREELTTDEITVLSILRLHHGYQSAKQNFEDLTNDVILEKIKKKWPSETNWNLTRVRNTMSILFKGKKRYDRLCGQKAINLEIFRIENPGFKGVYASGKLDHIPAPKDMSAPEGIPEPED